MHPQNQEMISLEITAASQNSVVRHDQVPWDGNTCISSLHLSFIVLFLHALCFLAQPLAPEKLPSLKTATASGAAALHFASDPSSFLCVSHPSFLLLF